jgi:aldehyde dehydrogenase (NAD+)
LFGRKDLFIHGEDVRPAGDEYFETRNPADTRQVLAEVARGRAADIARAVDDAHDAYNGWRRTLPADRGRVLAVVAAQLLAHLPELAQMETLDNGKPLSLARGDVELAARYFEYYAGAADKIQGDTIPLGQDYLSYTLLEPYGVTGHIVPWNAPLQQAARGIAPALAAGNTVVCKPAEDTPLTALAMARLATQAGLPPGAFNVVPGYGPEAGGPLVVHPKVRKVTFTGSVETGQIVMHAAADKILPLTLELGGKSPHVVFADADLDAAARSAFLAINRNAGQACSAGSRLLVQASVHDEFVQRVLSHYQTVSMGPGIEDPFMGPLATQDQFGKVRSYQELGAKEGAAVAIGGGLPGDDNLRHGFFVEPTLFTGVSPDMRIAQEEIFGPVLCVLPFTDEADAIRIANGTDYGLAAGIWTSDLGRAHRVAAEIEAGQVYVNQYFAGGVETPFGGTKASGIGREKGIEGLRNYLHSKTVTVRL